MGGSRPAVVTSRTPPMSADLQVATESATVSVTPIDLPGRRSSTVRGSARRNPVGDKRRTGRCRRLPHGTGNRAKPSVPTTARCLVVASGSRAMRTLAARRNRALAMNRGGHDG